MPVTDFAEIRVPEGPASLLLASVKDIEVGFWCVGGHEPGKRRTFDVQSGCRLANIENCFEQFELVGIEKILGRAWRRFPQLTFRYARSHSFELGADPAVGMAALANEFETCAAATQAELIRYIELLQSPSWAHHSVSDVSMRALALARLCAPDDLPQRSEAILAEVRRRDPHYFEKPKRFAEWLLAELKAE